MTVVTVVEAVSATLIWLQEVVGPAAACQFKCPVRQPAHLLAGDPKHHLLPFFFNPTLCHLQQNQILSWS